MDIDRALLHGFPADSAHKLESRRERCKAALVREEGGDSPSSGDAPPAVHDVSAFQSDAISVVSTPECGRHMKVGSPVCILGAGQGKQPLLV